MNIRTIEKYIIYFICYSLIGWLYEVFLEVYIYRWGFSNRGVLTGPYCPIYGVGAVIFLMTAGRIIKDKKYSEKIKFIPLVFLVCMASATAVELLGSYILEFFTGKWLWQTYENYKYNFQGRIALSTSIRFGLGGVLMLYALQPVFEKAVSNLKKLHIPAVLILSVLTADIVYTFVIK